MSCCPFGVAQPVENVPPQRAFRQARMVEIVVRCAGHAEALHDPARALVGGNRHGDDFLQLELTKAVIECGPGGLGRVALAQ